MLELLDLDDLGIALDAAHEGVFDRPPDAAGKGQELIGRKRLVAKKQHQMLEPGLANLGALFVRQRAGEVDAADLGAQGAGHAVDRDAAISNLGRHDCEYRVAGHHPG